MNERKAVHNPPGHAADATHQGTSNPITGYSPRTTAASGKNNIGARNVTHGGKEQHIALGVLGSEVGRLGMGGLKRNTTSSAMDTLRNLQSVSAACR